MSKGLVYSFPQKSKEAAGFFLVTCRRKDKKAQSKELITKIDSQFKIVNPSDLGRGSRGPCIITVRCREIVLIFVLDHD